MGKPRVRDWQRGFTLLELMVTVAIIAILAVVVIPYFFGESRKAKAKTEVAPMFAELAQKEEAFKIDNGVYQGAAACPALPTAQQQSAIPCITGVTPWTALRVLLPMNNLYCSYTVFAGPALTPPTVALTTGAFAMPICPGNCPTSWYTIFAQCDMDGNPGFSEYFTNSTDSSIQIHNEGQ